MSSYWELLQSHTKKFQNQFQKFYHKNNYFTNTVHLLLNTLKNNKEIVLPVSKRPTLLSI